MLGNMGSEKLTIQTFSGGRSTGHNEQIQQKNINII
jgi:hypothetical protein